MNKRSMFLLLFLLTAVMAAIFFSLHEPIREVLVPGISAQREPVKEIIALDTSSLPASPLSPSPIPDISFEVISPHKPAKYIFIMIGDGMGEAQRDLAQSYAKFCGKKTPLIMNSLPVSGTVTTNSLNASVTDSAAAATALATGHKTNNKMISVSPKGEEHKTIIEEAEDKGLSTGLVTTTSLTNATPAAFAAHEKNRNSEADIALDYLDSGVDFFAGGGARFFLPSSYSAGLDALGAPLKSSRNDEKDLVSDFEDAGYKTFIGHQGAEDFKYYSPSEGDRVLASFTNSHMPYETERKGKGLITPSLADMTRKAIETLQADEDGFMLVVEGGRIDHACHINDAAGAVFETLSFNEAVEEAYTFYSEHPEETLVIVVADHETGGLKPDSEKLKLFHIKGISLSLQDSLQNVYNGDREAFFEYLAANFGLDDLDPTETSRIKKALDTADKANRNKGYGTLVALAVADILSERIGVSWSGTGHTGVPVPLYAVGMFAEDFSGNIDNTDVGLLLLSIINS